MLLRRLLGEILVEQGKVTEEQLNHALQVQRDTGQRVGDILLSLEIISASDLDEALAIHYDVPYESLNDPIDRDVLDLVPPPVALTTKVLPVAVDDQFVHLAMANPNDLGAIDWVQGHLRKSVAPRYCPLSKLERALAFYYGSHEAIEDVPEIITDTDSGRYSIEDEKRASEEPPVVALVNAILSDAVRLHTSDIHFEPTAESLLIRNRVDGVLKRTRVLPKKLQNAIISRVKIMSDLDISERRLPQDGRIGLKISGRQIDLRVSSFPTRHGERLVLRVLDKQRGIKKLDEMGLAEENIKKLRSLIMQPYGMILITGPTGSGKTTMLYAALSELRDDKRNILTCEDPVEYELEGISQSQVNDQIGLTFSAQLRSALRQDPDVILVGEIRDQETAETACRAAMTGHLVLSTLHTNTASAAIPRLVDMGIETFLINSAILGIAAQRLIRSLCPNCKQRRKPTEEEMETCGLSITDSVWRAVGCNECDNIGYKGRAAIQELLVIDDDIRQLVSENISAAAIQELAVSKGLVPLHKDGIRLMLEGITTYEEIKPFIIAGEMNSDKLRCQKSSAA